MTNQEHAYQRPEFDYWDDDLRAPPRDEPYCPDCSDTGCRWCNPSRARTWWRQHIGRPVHRMKARWKSRNIPEDEPPF